MFMSMMASRRFMAKAYFDPSRKRNGGSKATETGYQAKGT
jgi:hypothetical protein